VRSRFARVRVRAAHRDTRRREPRAEEWLPTELIEWPADEEEPTKYKPATLPARVTLRAPVDTAKLRWRVERDYVVPPRGALPLRVERHGPTSITTPRVRVTVGRLARLAHCPYCRRPTPDPRP
jgi:hypothetical protein